MIKLKEKIESLGGELTIREPVRTVQDKDDRLLAALMESLEKQNQEVDGDTAVDE